MYGERPSLSVLRWCLRQLYRISARQSFADDVVVFFLISPDPAQGASVAPASPATKTVAAAAGASSKKHDAAGALVVPMAGEAGSADGVTSPGSNGSAIQQLLTAVRWSIRASACVCVICVCTTAPPPYSHVALLSRSSALSVSLFLCISVSPCLCVSLAVPLLARVSCSAVFTFISPSRQLCPPPTTTTPRLRPSSATRSWPFRYTVCCGHPASCLCHGTHHRKLQVAPCTTSMVALQV